MIDLHYVVAENLYTFLSIAKVESDLFDHIQYRNFATIFYFIEVRSTSLRPQKKRYLSPSSQS